jgi:Polymerase beta, Nucleotidyltransferase
MEFSGRQLAPPSLPRVLKERCLAVDVDRDPSPLAALVPSYRLLFDRLLSVCENDDRIRALWLSGSLAKGTADGGSDLDIVVAIRDTDFDEFVDHWREWLATITPTLLARELPFAPGCFYTTTTGCERLDVISEPVSKLSSTRHRYRRVIFDRDGLDATVPAPDPLPGPDIARLRWIVEEFFRIEAITPFMLDQRRDFLVVVEGVQSLQRMLYQVFVECNQPQPPMGIKQWSARLTSAQREILTALPVAKPERESLVVALKAVVSAMRTAGRAAVTACGASWPTDLDDGVQRFFERSFQDP